MTRRNGPGQASLLFLLTTGGLVALGCGDPSTSPEPPTYSVEPLHQWAGGTVTVTPGGVRFEIGDVIARGDDTLAIVELSVQSASVRIPSDANGPTVLTVRRAGQSLGTVELEAYGYAGMRVYPELMADQITKLPGPNGGSVVGPASRSQDPNEGFVWIHPSAGTHRLFPGSPGMGRLFHTGVDPATGEIYYEWYTDCSAEDGCQDRVHAGSIVGGDLVDTRWIDRPCDRWGCFPLAGDIWILPDWGYTCRVTSTPEGETCVQIDRTAVDDPRGTERLWSADAALVLFPDLPVFRLSTGEVRYRGNWPPALEDLRVESAAVDEARGFFYVSAHRLEEDEESLRLAIVTLTAENGSLDRAFELTLTCPVGLVPPVRCEEPDLGYADRQDVIFVVRRDTWTIEVRDGATYAMLGEIAMAEHPERWLAARVMVDETSDRAFVVFSASSRFETDRGRYEPILGTPVVEFRLPPL